MPTLSLALSCNEKRAARGGKGDGASGGMACMSGAKAYEGIIDVGEGGPVGATTPYCCASCWWC